LSPYAPLFGSLVDWIDYEHSREALVIRHAELQLADDE